MKLKKMPRQVIILGMVSFFTDIASEMLYPVAPIFLASLGASMALVGILEGAASVIAGVLKGYFGALSDKLGKRSIFVLLGYGLSGLIKPLPGFFPSVATVIASRLTDRIGKGVRTSPRDALLAGHAGENTGAVFGFHRSMDTLGAMLGPVAALLLLYFYPGNYALVYLAAILPSLGAIYFTFLVRDPAETTGKKREYSYRKFWSEAPSKYKLLLLLFTIFSFVNSSDVFLILKSRNLFNSDTMAIAGYIFFNFVYAFSSYPAGLLSDRIGKKYIFSIGLIIFSIVYFGFAFNSSQYLLWLLFAFYGFYSAATEGISKAWVSDLIKDTNRGSAIGLLNSLSSFGVMAGSAATGFLWDYYGASIPFMISGIVSLIIAIFILTAFD